MFCYPVYNTYFFNFFIICKVYLYTQNIAGLELRIYQGFRWELTIIFKTTDLFFFKYFEWRISSPSFYLHTLHKSLKTRKVDLHYLIKLFKVQLSVSDSSRVNFANYLSTGQL